MSSENWTTEIKPKTGWFDINLKELLQYKDLIIMFVKRDFIQTNNFRTIMDNYKSITNNNNVYNSIWQHSKYIN